MKMRRLRPSGRSLLACLVVPAMAMWMSTPAAAEEPLSTALSVFAKAAPEGLDDLQTMEARVGELVTKLTPSTVAVRVGGAMGSGVVIEGGYVLTAGHVSGKPGQRATVILHDGKRLAAETLGRNQQMDSGLIKLLDEADIPTVAMGSTDDLKRGDWCLCLGHPGGYQAGRPPVVRLGRVVRIEPTAIRTDCTLVGGDSGGPLFDMQGRVIGIHSRIAASLTANFHVPIDTFVNTFDRLAEGLDFDGSSRPVIGVRGEDHERGCRVVELFQDLPAKKAGLREGDVIVRLGKVTVGGLGDLVGAVNNHLPGDEVTIEFLRGNERIIRKVTIAEHPQPSSSSDE